MMELPSPNLAGPFSLHPVGYTNINTTLIQKFTSVNRRMDSFSLSDRRKSLTVPGANNFAAAAGSGGGGGVGGTKSASSSPVGDSVPIPSAGAASGGGHGKLGGDKTGSPRHRTSNDAWVCPNDRQLALRAK